MVRRIKGRCGGSEYKVVRKYRWWQFYLHGLMVSSSHQSGREDKKRKTKETIPAIPPVLLHHSHEEDQHKSLSLKVE